MPQTESDKQRRGGGFDKDSFKRRITTEWLKHQLPHWQPKPQDSPCSNRKHLFRSDNSTERLWGPSLWDIKRIRKGDEGRKRDQPSDADRARREGHRETHRETWRKTKTQSETKNRHCVIEEKWLLFCSSAFRGKGTPVPQWLHKGKRRRRGKEWKRR